MPHSDVDGRKELGSPNKICRANREREKGDILLSSTEEKP